MDDEQNSGFRRSQPESPLHEIKPLAPKCAVILAGGLGTRLRPYSTVIPKPLVPVGKHPILEIILKQLVEAGFERAILAISHHTRLIKAYFGHGEGWDIKLDYSIEEKPLGTMGPLKLIEDLPDNFLVMNGDILTDIDYAAFYNQHIAQGQNMTIAYTKQERRSEFGVLQIEGDQLVGFEEKPIMHTMVSMGIYMLNRQILSSIPPDQHFGFDQLIVKLLETKEYPAAYFHPGVWLDIGRAQDYDEADRLFQSMELQPHVG